jgi:outer membrane protein OmpA-like peptidoglycan-associated protein
MFLTQHSVQTAMNVNTLKIIALLACSIMAYTSSAQAFKQIRNAERAFYEGDYAEAYNLYKSIELKFDTLAALDEYFKEVSYHLSDGIGTDIFRLEQLGSKIGVTEPFHPYWMGLVYLRRHEFEKAGSYFTAFKNTESYKTREIASETEFYLNAIQKLLNEPQNTSYEIMPLAEINTSFAEVSPSFMVSEESVIFSKVASDDEIQFLVSKKIGGTWEEPSIINSSSDDFNPIATTQPGGSENIIYLFKGRKNIGIHKVQLQDGAFTAFEYIPSKFNKKNVIHSNFYISPDERLILISAQSLNNSLDIFESSYNTVTDSWSDPVVIKGLDTEYDEESPFLTSDQKTIYFSRNDEEGLGGFDIYKADFDEDKKSVSTISHMAYPVNSPENDLDFAIYDDGLFGFFSSDRKKAAGDYDLYYFEENQRIAVKGNVRDEFFEPLGDVTINFIAEGSDEEITVITDEKGNYAFDSRIKEDYKVEFYLNKQLVETREFKAKTYDILSNNYTIALSEAAHVAGNSLRSGPGKAPIKKPDRNQKITETVPSVVKTSKGKSTANAISRLGTKYQEGEKVVIPNIYFASGSADLIIDNDEIINRVYEILSANRELVVEVGGHTDALEAKKHGEYLSYLRAKMIVEKLVSMGIPEDRLVPIGFGSADPLATNDDEKDGREINRRIELYVKRFQNFPN